MTFKLTTPSKPLFALFTLLLLSSFYFHENIGGSGFRIPNNIVVWIFASFIGFYGLYITSRSSGVTVPRFFLFTCAFPVLALFSGMFSGVIHPTDWFLRLLYIWGGLLFLFALFQFRLRPKQIDQLTLLIISSGSVHAGVGISQIFLGTDLPEALPINPSSMPTGYFQQINNQASFMATTLVLSLWLFTRPSITHGAKWKSNLLFLAVIASSFVISFSGSRVAVLSLALALPLLILSRWQPIKRAKKRWLFIFLSIILATVSASKIENNRGLAYVAEKATAANAGYSGEARLGIYSISFDLIEESPLFGHGIGSFVKAWQLSKPEFYEKHPDATLPTQRVSHPHNELIFWLVEGGLVAGAGLVLLLIGVLRALLQLPHSRRYAYASLLMPIALHTQVELPFYISSLHWFIFLFLLFMALHPLRQTYKNSLSEAAKKLVKVLVVTGTVTSSAFMGHTMAANMEFRDYILKQADPEQPFAIAMTNPYFEQLATQVTMSLLFERSYQYGIKENMLLYAEWIEQELQLNPNISLFKLAIKARLSLQDEKKACELNKTAQAIYPRDENLNKLRSECEKAGI